MIFPFCPGDRRLSMVLLGITPPARLMRRGQAVTPVRPQSVRNHPTPQGLMRDLATMHLRQFLRRECQTKIRIPLAHKRQCPGNYINFTASIWSRVGLQSVLAPPLPARHD